MSEYPSFEIYGLRFVMTCGACPEQYDVFHGDEQIGYVRLRHGCLTVAYPHVGGECILQTTDLKGDGIFADEREREKWLKGAAVFLHERHDTWPDFKWSLSGD